MPSLETQTYKMRLEFFDEGGSPLLEVPLTEQDFARAVESAFFDGLRRGKFTEYAPPLADARIEPRFTLKNGSPTASGFRVLMPTPDGAEHRFDFGAPFLKSHAQRILVDRVVQGEVEPGTIQYRLAAYLDDTPETSAAGIRFEPDEPTIPIRKVRRASLGRTVLWDDPSGEDLPVLVSRHVLEDAVQTAAEAPEREVGGFLLGHLCRDDDTNELFLWATAHVPAEGTDATATSVTFTAETWARARDVVALRGEGEIFAGWVHSHPFRFCAECPNPPKPDCVGKVLFFSPEDHFLMEVTFAQPFMVALQTAVEPRLKGILGHLPVRMYGWRDGVVVPRGFEVIED